MFTMRLFFISNKNDVDIEKMEVHDLECIHQNSIDEQPMWRKCHMIHFSLMESQLTLFLFSFSGIYLRDGLSKEQQIKVSCT